MSEQTYTLKDGAALIERYGEALRPTLLAIAQAAGISLTRIVALQKLSGDPLTSGGISAATGRQTTGTLRRDVLASPEAELVGDWAARARFGTSLRYGVAHEEGFHGPVQVSAHTRRDPRSGREVEVRAHERIANVRAKFYLSGALRENGNLVERLSSAALELLARDPSHPPTAGTILGKAR